MGKRTASLLLLLGDQGVAPREVLVDEGLVFGGEPFCELGPFIFGDA